MIMGNKQHRVIDRVEDRSFKSTLCMFSVFCSVRVPALHCLLHVKMDYQLAHSSMLLDSYDNYEGMPAQYHIFHTQLKNILENFSLEKISISCTYYTTAV